MNVTGYQVKDNCLLIYTDAGIISMFNKVKNDRNTYKTVSACRFKPSYDKTFHDVYSWAHPVIEDDVRHIVNDGYMEYDDSFPLH